MIEWVYQIEYEERAVQRHMIKSMTGFGRAQRLIGGRDITVEMRSVNHRFFEFSLRAPRAYGFLEEKLKSFVQGKVSRGKIDMSVSITVLDDNSAQVQINHPLAKSYLDALREMGETLGIRDDVTVTALTAFPDIFTVRKIAEDEDEVWDGVKAVAEEAAAAFLRMREQEGGRLREDILAKGSRIRALLETVKEQATQTVAQYRERLYAKLCEVLSDSRFDDQRILTEAAIFAEKVAIDEETVRLESHLCAMDQILGTEDAVGRKLDFLVQEMNREVNTIGSKAQDAAVARVVVEMKSEIEKIREQIQNLE